MIIDSFVCNITTVPGTIKPRNSSKGDIRFLDAGRKERKSFIVCIPTSEVKGRATILSGTVVHDN